MLSKSYRLRARGSFSYVRAHGAKVGGKLISFVALKGNCKRIGFVVSNKIGKAVRRNLVKRRMRGVVRELLPRLSCGQMIFIAKPGVTELSYAEIKTRMTTLLVKAGYLSL
ncbi:MAG: ribonuclease P protein component [Clostridia bacterium]|nr:ribonuclease P protein component [Clostridia bacterium]